MNNIFTIIIIVAVCIVSYTAGHTRGEYDGAIEICKDKVYVDIDGYMTCEKQSLNNYDESPGITWRINE